MRLCPAALYGAAVWAGLPSGCRSDRWLPALWPVWAELACLCGSLDMPGPGARPPSPTGALMRYPCWDGWLGLAGRQQVGIGPSSRILQKKNRRPWKQLLPLRAPVLLSKSITKSGICRFLQHRHGITERGLGTAQMRKNFMHPCFACVCGRLQEHEVLCAIFSAGYFATARYVV